MVKTTNKSSFDEGNYITVESQVTLIRRVAYGEIAFGVLILYSQTVAIASSHEFATRSLTGIWTSWFFFISAGITLFWSSRCTFNGLLSVLVLQIISATMGIPLFTASCLLFGVYPFKWHLSDSGAGAALVGSSISILVTNLVMMFSSIAEMILNGYNAYNCYFLAYGGKVKEQDPDNEYDYNIDYEDESGRNSGKKSKSSRPSTSQPQNLNQTENEDYDDQYNQDDNWGDNGDGDATDNNGQNMGKTPTRTNGTKTKRNIGPKNNTKIEYDDPAMPQPPTDTTLAMTDLTIIKYCGMTGVVLAFIIFCSQTAMLALASEAGIRIGIGIWGALFYATTGVITLYNGLKPTAQSSVAIFILQSVQLILSIPLVGIAYYIVAVFGSCIQFRPISECPQSAGGGLAVTILGAVMALCGTVQGLIALVLMLICSQAVCGIRCMVSGATVYPTL